MTICHSTYFICDHHEHAYRSRNIFKQPATVNDAIFRPEDYLEYIHGVGPNLESEGQNIPRVATTNIKMVPFLKERHDMWAEVSGHYDLGSR